MFFNLTSAHVSLCLPCPSSPAVLSLQCYVCSSSATNEECNNNTQECQAPLDTCMTTVDTLGNNESNKCFIKGNYDERFGALTVQLIKM